MLLKHRGNVPRARHVPSFRSAAHSLVASSSLPEFSEFTNNAFPNCTAIHFQLAANQDGTPIIHNNA